jgi:hypothetical protein
MENNYGSMPKPIYSSSNISGTNNSMFGESLFSTKNTLIFILVVLLLFSLLGINILGLIGNFITNIVQTLKPLVLQILSMFGFITGTVMDKSADVIHSGGDLILNASMPNLNNAIQSQGVFKNNQPSPDSTTNPIQNPISSGKANWCLVGEYQGKRGCISITDSDKCLSGQVFPNQQMCLNPTMGYPNTPLKSVPE